MYSSNSEEVGLLLAHGWRRSQDPDSVFSQPLCPVQFPRIEILSPPGAYTETSVNHSLEAFLIMSQTLTDIQ